MDICGRLVVTSKTKDPLFLKGGLRLCAQVFWEHCGSLPGNSRLILEIGYGRFDYQDDGCNKDNPDILNDEFMEIGAQYHTEEQQAHFQ
jgi:hypothetical protein